MIVFLAVSCPEGELNGLQIFSTEKLANDYCERENSKGVHSSAYEWYVVAVEVDKENANV